MVDKKKVKRIRRRTHLRAVVETFRNAHCVAEGLHDSRAVRAIATELEVPYLLLWIDLHLDTTAPDITVADIAAWNADADAQAVMAQWIGEGLKEEPKGASKAAVA